MDEKLTPYTFGKAKKKTNHVKGVAPQHALKKRRTGAVNVSYITKYKDRLRTLSARSKGLWKKANELAVLTGIALRLVIRGEYFDSVEAGVAKETHVEATSGISEQTVSTPETVTSEPQTKDTTDLSDPLLSPRACRPCEQPETSTSGATVFHEPNRRDVGVQCTSITPITDTGVEGQCRLCGQHYDNDSEERKKLWMGCTATDCRYWIHADCLLGTSKKLTPKLLKQIPFQCPAHNIKK